MGGEARTCAVWPLFYFAPEWDFQEQRFAHGVQLLRPGDDAVGSLIDGLRGWCQLWQHLRDSMGPEDFDSNWGDCPVWDQSPLKWEEVELSWLLCVEVNMAGPQDRPVSELGISFQHELEEETARTFLATLRLLKDAYFFAPIRLRAPVTPQGPAVAASTLASDFWMLPLANPDRSPSVDQFVKRDIKQIQKVWKRRAKLAGLTDMPAPGSANLLSWREAILREAVFRKLDRNFGRLVGIGDLSVWASTLEEVFGVPLPTETVREIVERFREPDAIATERGEAPEDTAKERRRLYQRRFREIREEYSSKTRLGRALTLFDEAVAFPPGARLIQMWTVLEALLTERKQENIGHYIALRLSSLLGEPCEPEIVELWKDRSAVVHGEKDWSEVRMSVPRVFAFARRCLVTILSGRDPLEPGKDLFEKFTGSEKAAVDYLRKLDKE